MKTILKLLFACLLATASVSCSTVQPAAASSPVITLSQYWNGKFMFAYEVVELNARLHYRLIPGVLTSTHDGYLEHYENNEIVPKYYTSTSVLASHLLTAYAQLDLHKATESESDPREIPMSIVIKIANYDLNQELQISGNNSAVIYVLSASPFFYSFCDDLSRDEDKSHQLIFTGGGDVGRAVNK